MNRSRPLYAWAERLLAAEAANSAAASTTPPAVRISQRLRSSLTRLIGPDGFNALLKRALTLARAEFPALHAVNIASDGDLEGIEALADGGEAATLVFAHVLGLLIAFIGESLTLRMMLDAFPDAPRPSIGELQDLT